MQKSLSAGNHRITLPDRSNCKPKKRMILAINALTGSTRNNKPTLQELEMTALMEKSNKKLDILKHGLQKCNVQLAALTGGDSPRQKQVTHELLETEQDYATDLKHIVILFLRPLTMSGNMSDADARQVFSNINQIAELHEGLAADMGRCKADPHNQRRTLQALKENSAFVKALAQCEAAPELHKLILEDLLVKPLHRVTRYPILLKRLLSHIKADAPEHRAVIMAISRIEAQVALVNEAVRKREAEFRIHLIDEKMDFGGVVDKFKLADGIRELVSEKPFTYLKKHSKGSSASVDVLVLVFTDMVLITREKKNGKIVLYKPPIPFEAAVFLDKPDILDSRNVFQIVHLQHEMHTLRARSAYDKNRWLAETSARRGVFCTSFCL
ncbi:hypothetical protein SeMB42_g03195 [Synchytrium endobioticum]|uniref:DH domain-containing protein n=1 Tax=Synchytrium endobioticum TaxID=286115 RepID=A0A507D8X1_9FUNG|nr:hypothetical protein SeMB42_g03195 [Synchytrium endobioticum]